jgi:DNA-binding HxlR family transcriptional regulator
MKSADERPATCTPSQQSARKCYTCPMDTVDECAVVSSTDALVSELLSRVADKWTLLIIDALAGGEPVRFTRLREMVSGVSQKMLTKTLRQLERDGLVTRRVHPVIPPHVDYTITKSGFELGEAVCAFWEWVETNAASVAASRQAFAEREKGVATIAS